MSKVHDPIMGQSATTAQIRQWWEEIRELPTLQQKEHEAYGLCLDWFAAMLRTIEYQELALGNCLSLSARRRNKDNPDWKAVRRFCEEGGVKPSILRAAVTQENVNDQ